MKTFLFACERARECDVADPYLYVTAVLMSKIIMTRDKSLQSSRTVTYQEFRLLNFAKFHNN